MPHDNTVFHAVLQHMAWDELDAAVRRHGARDMARGFSFRDQMVAMVFAQLAGATSLRHVEAALRSHAARLYHLGVDPAARSTLADANRDRPSAVFADVLAAMIGRAHRRLRQQMDGVTCLIDSTNLMLGPRSARWARFSAEACGAKLHLLYDPDADCPLYVAVTPLTTNDITPAKAMPIVAGATYVFDLGYYDYAFWAALHDAGCRIVTRLKQNTPLTVVEQRPVVPGGAILSDRVGTLPQRLARSRRNPLAGRVREITLRLDTGRILRIVTNDRDAPAAEIAALYKRRWAIELFFRWVKQTLRITRFLGTSENAVRIQVTVALITFLLLRLAQRTQHAVTGTLAFIRLVSSNLMHRRRLDQLTDPPPPPIPPHGQASLFPT